MMGPEALLQSRDLLKRLRTVAPEGFPELVVARRRDQRVKMPQNALLQRMRVGHVQVQLGLEVLGERHDGLVRSKADRCK